jgi:hypothetical protein
MSTILKLTVTSPVQSFEEPVTMAEIREALGIPDADTSRDTLFQAYAPAAREVAEACQQRDLVAKQWDLYLSHFYGEAQQWGIGVYCSPTGHITLRDNATAVTTFRYRKSDGDYVTMVEGTDYEFDSKLCILTPVSNGTWPTDQLWPSSAIEIQFTVTPPAISSRLKRGILALISLWDANQVPAELGASAVQEYPFMLSLLSIGKREIV